MTEPEVDDYEIDYENDFDEEDIVDEVLSDR